jgi:putative redox protein
MVKMTLEYHGGLHCVATHGPSGTTLTTDAPVDNHGKGESFSPTDLVAAALGACMATIMGVYAEAHGLDLKGMRVEVAKEMAANPRRIAKLITDIWLPAGVAKSPALEAAARTCPVHQSLHPEMEKPINFHYSA